MHQLTLRVDDATLRAMDVLCESRNVTRTTVLRMALLDYLGGRSESEAVGLTLARLIDAIEALSSTLGQIRLDVQGTVENTRITAEMIEATLKVLLYRTVPPPEDDGAARARAASDYAELTKRIARKLGG